MASSCKTRPASHPPTVPTDIASIPGLSELWSETLGDVRICIAVLDGPVGLAHPSVSGAKLTPVETLASTGATVSGTAAEHGTQIASVIFGSHNGPIRGIAPQCRGLIAPIFTDVVGDSPAPCSQLDLARALLQALQAGAHVINVSGGQFSPSGTAHPILADAVRACAASGVLIVAAAGNQGCDCLHIPGALPSVLAVGAMDSRGDPLPFSNWGAVYESQGILAPGDNILVASSSGGTTTSSGTSFATAIVSGVAALLLSLQLKLGQKLDVGSVRQALLDSALGCGYQPIPDCRRLLAGRLNVRGATSLITWEKRTMSDSALQSSSLIDSPPEIAPASNSVLPASVCVTPTPMSPEPPRASSANGSVAQSAVGGAIAPSDCGCAKCAGSGAQLVYALGQPGYDFGTEARRDAFIQAMDEPAPGVRPNPFDPAQLLKHLQKNPWDASSVTWTLSLDGTTVYAIAGQGPFASEVYSRLRQFLADYVDPQGSDRVSIPGHISGKVRLMNGQTVPVIVPELRGMYSWTTQGLVGAVVGTPLADSASHQDKQERAKRESGLREFLDRIYFQLCNLGITPQDRALNFAGTNAFNIEKVYESAIKEEMDLDTIEVERSSICRPESDCWHVKLFFFFPDRQVQTVRKVYRFTVDVSDVVPVTVGPVRSWFVR